MLPSPLCCGLMDFKSGFLLQQAKDLQLGWILIYMSGMFFVTNLPRLLLNLYELFYLDTIIECGDAFLPPTWFICCTSANHLLTVFNSLMNFTINFCFFDYFRVILCGIKDSPSNLPSPWENSGAKTPHLELLDVRNLLP